MECARACGAAPKASVLYPARPSTAAWRARLLARDAFRAASAEIAEAWGV